MDVLFRSAANYAGKNAVGVIMTGMGDDGAKGFIEMKEAGARNIAQGRGDIGGFRHAEEAIKLGSVAKIDPTSGKRSPKKLFECEFKEKFVSYELNRIHK